MIKSIINFFRNLSLKEKVYKEGLTKKEVVEFLENNTHCGKYWNMKAKSKLFSNLVTIEMSGNEKYEYDMLLGKGKRHDWDFDGCCDSNDFTFKLLKKNDKIKLKILNRI